VILFRRPTNQPERLETDVLGTLVPRCRAIPGLERLEVSSTHGGLEAGKGDRRGPPALMLELYFADRTAFDAALVSAEGHDAINYALDISDREFNAFVAEVRPEAG
jgi:hypothetical protein